MNGVRSTHSSSLTWSRWSIICLFSCVFSAVLSTAVFAQSIDNVGPVIELEELAEAEADNSQVFTVQIAEDVLLKDATLYYRREGQLPFTPAPMKALGDTGYFSVSIPTDSTDLRTIEYYVQARDEAGNRTVSGFAFDPYQRRLQPSSERVDAATNTEPTVDVVQADTAPNEELPPLFRQRWFQVVLGVVAVGVIASAAGGGGGEDSEVVPLTFNLQ